MKLNYIKSQLQSGEEIIESAELHWFFNIYYIYPFIFLSINAVFAILLAVFIYFYINSFEMAVTNKRVIAKLGVIRRKTFEINLKKVEGCNLDQSIFGRMFGYASLIIKGTGGGISPFPFVKNYEKLKIKISEAVDLNQ